MNGISGWSDGGDGVGIGFSMASEPTSNVSLGMIDLAKLTAIWSVVSSMGVVMNSISIMDDIDREGVCMVRSLCVRRRTALDI